MTVPSVSNVPELSASVMGHIAKGPGYGLKSPSESALLLLSSFAGIFLPPLPPSGHYLY